MTEIQAIHHSEQVAAARAEFRAVFSESVAKTRFYQSSTDGQKIEMETRCWQEFLKAKGLKQ